MKYRVWITGHPGSYIDVEAHNATLAMRLGAKAFRYHHNGEIEEINARPIVCLPAKLLARSKAFVRIRPTGYMEFV